MGRKPRTNKYLLIWYRAKGEPGVAQEPVDEVTTPIAVYREEGPRSYTYIHRSGKTPVHEHSFEEIISGMLEYYDIEYMYSNKQEAIAAAKKSIDWAHVAITIQMDPD